MDGIYTICKAAAIALLVATMTLLFVSTCLRYFLNITLSWSEELCRYMVIWFSFLGSGIGIRNSIHVGFDLIKNKLPEKVKPAWTVMLSAMTFAGSFVLISGGVSFVKQASLQTSASLGISMGYVYMSLLIGAVLIALFSLETMVKVMVREK